MSHLPPGWEWATLSEIAEVRLGRQRSPKNHTGPNMRPYLRAANVTWAGLDLTDVKEMNFTSEEVEVYRLQKGDVVLAEASGSPGEVGKPAVWNEEIVDCCFQNTLLRVRSHGPLPDFLAHLLRFEAVTGRFGRAAPGVGIHHLGAKRLSEWLVPLPPIAEQRRIVDAIEEQLSRLDSAEDLLRCAARRTARLWRATMSTVAAPDGDAWVPLGELAGVQGGIQKQPKRRPVHNAYPFLRVANVGRGSLDLSDVHRAELFGDELARYRLEPGDLLVVEGNGSPEQIGRSALWQGEIANAVHQNHLIRVRPGPELDPRYLNLYWNAPQTADRLRAVASSTSGLYTLSTSKLRAVPVRAPAMDEQRRIVSEVERQLSLLNAISVAINEAQVRSEGLQKAILERAITGRLTAQDPSDEPASALLERIRAEREAAPKQRRSGPRRASSSTS